MINLKTNLEMLYKPNMLIISQWFKEPESQEYCAHTYMLNAMRVVFRTAKMTPKKVGQFVTLWKRESTGPIQPFDLSDSVDLFVINISNGKHHGQFVFPKNILYKKGIVSKNQKGGKRAIRVYPPWDVTESPQAKKTQNWQLEYFLALSSVDHTAVDRARVRMLYGI